jgi:hypothetical protein
LKNEDGLLGDFRADTVAGEDGEVQEHAVSLTETALVVRAPGERAERNFIRARPYTSMGVFPQRG